MESCIAEVNASSNAPVYHTQYAMCYHSCCSTLSTMESRCIAIKCTIVAMVSEIRSIQGCEYYAGIILSIIDHLKHT